MADNIEPTVTETIPAFSSEQRLIIREAQVKMLTLQTQSRQLQDQADQLAKAIINQINQIASQMQVDPTKYNLDIENLAFVPITK